jgi:hypothetical protein
MKFAPIVTALFFASMVPGPLFALAEGRISTLIVVQIAHVAVGFVGVVMCSRRAGQRSGMRLVLMSLVAALPVFVAPPFFVFPEVRWHSSAMMPFYIVARFPAPAAGGDPGTVVIGYDVMSLMFLWVMGDFAWRRGARCDVATMIDAALLLAFPLVIGGYGARAAGLGYSPLLLATLTAIGGAVIVLVRRGRWLHHAATFVDDSRSAPPPPATITSSTP